MYAWNGYDESGVECSSVCSHLCTEQRIAAREIRIVENCFLFQLLSEFISVGFGMRREGWTHSPFVGRRSLSSISFQFHWELLPCYESHTEKCFCNLLVENFSSGSIRNFYILKISWRFEGIVDIRHNHFHCILKAQQQMPLASVLHRLLKVQIRSQPLFASSRELQESLRWWEILETSSSAGSIFLLPPKYTLENISHKFKFPALTRTRLWVKFIRNGSSKVRTWWHVCQLNWNLYKSR